jgi:hypothetical protein
MGIDVIMLSSLCIIIKRGKTLGLALQEPKRPCKYCAEQGLFTKFIKNVKSRADLKYDDSVCLNILNVQVGVPLVEWAEARTMNTNTGIG